MENRIEQKLYFLKEQFYICKDHLQRWNSLWMFNLIENVIEDSGMMP